MTMKEIKRQMIQCLKVMRTTENFSEMINNYVRILELTNVSLIRYDRLASKIFNRKKYRFI